MRRPQAGEHKVTFFVLLAVGLALTSNAPVSAATPEFKTSSLTISQGETGQISLSLSQAPEGLRLYQVKLSFGNNKVANLINVSEGTIPLQVLTREDDTVEFRGADLEERVEGGASDLELAIIEVEGVNKGESAIELEVDKGNTINDEGTVLSFTQNPGKITVGEGKQLQADFIFSPSEPEVGETVQLDASASSDPDGSITEYNWDLNGDGTYDESGQRISTSWSSSGSRSIKLRVVNGQGAEATSSQNIEVGSDRQPPQATFSYQPSTPTAGDIVQFDASESSDPDGGLISEYQWDLNSDGSFEKSGRTVTHTYDSSGRKQVALKVIDGEGSSDTSRKYLTVEGGTTGTEEKPTASIETTPIDPTQTGQTIEFSAASSSAADGYIEDYEWDLNNDGTYEESGQMVEHSYQQGGSQTVRLRVTDDGGQTDTTTTSFVLTSGGGGNLPWMIILLLVVIIIIGVVIYLSMVPEEGKKSEEDYELSPLD